MYLPPQFNDKDLVHARTLVRDQAFAQRMLAGIVAFELRVPAMQCKLNPHRPELHAAMLAAYESDNSDERALAGRMHHLGMTGQNTP